MRGMSKGSKEPVRRGGRGKIRGGRERLHGDSLAGFRSWLESMGRSPETVAMYAYDLGALMRDYGDPVDGLSDRSLAPSTRLHRRAALMSWATYTGDDDLRERIKAVLVPHQGRISAKYPLSREDWRLLREEIAGAEGDPAVRAVLGILAARGLRASDVLRMRRREVTAALRIGRLAFEAKGERRMEFLVRPIRGHLEELASYTGWDRVEDLLAPRSAPGRRRRAAKKRLERAIKRHARAVGLGDDVHLHQLRRTYATHYLSELEGDPQALTKLQQHMQWAGLATAARYADYHRDEDLDEVAQRLEIA